MSSPARSRRRPVPPPGLETRAGRRVGGPAESRERNEARAMAARILQGMRPVRTSFTHEGRRHEAGRSWWHVSAIPPRLWDHSAHTTEEIVAVSNRHEQPEPPYGVPPPPGRVVAAPPPRLRSGQVAGGGVAPGLSGAGPGDLEPVR